MDKCIRTRSITVILSSCNIRHVAVELVEIRRAGRRLSGQVLFSLRSPRLNLDEKNSPGSVLPQLVLRCTAIERVPSDAGLHHAPRCPGPADGEECAAGAKPLLSFHLRFNTALRKVCASTKGQIRLADL